MTLHTRILILLGLIAFTLAACGSDDAENTAGDDESSTTTEAPGDETDDESQEPPEAVTEGYTWLEPRDDLVSLETGVVEEIIVDPTDDSRLLLHYEGAAAPCSGAAVDVEETDTSVIIDFKVGLDPNAAAMTCIAQVFDYEVPIPLEAPLGDRSINLAG